MIQFFRKALNLRADFPRINKLFLLGICFFGFIIILNFITSLSWPHEEQMNLIKYPPDSLGPGIIKPYQIFIPFGILLLLSIILSFISWRKGNSASGYLCLSFMLPFLAVPLAGVIYLIFREHFYLIMPSATGFLLLSMFVTFGFSVAQNMNDLKRAVDQACDNKITVLVFHGVPGPLPPWVHTDPEDFEGYMGYLHAQECRVIAVRDLVRYVDRSRAPIDPYQPIRSRIQVQME